MTEITYRDCLLICIQCHMLFRKNKKNLVSLLSAKFARRLSFCLILNIMMHMYGKCPKILYTEVSDKFEYANSADPHQTAPKGAV